MQPYKKLGLNKPEFFSGGNLNEWVSYKGKSGKISIVYQEKIQGTNLKRIRVSSEILKCLVQIKGVRDMCSVSNFPVFSKILHMTTAAVKHNGVVFLRFFFRFHTIMNVIQGVPYVFGRLSEAV